MFQNKIIFDEIQYEVFYIFFGGGGGVVKNGGLFVAGSKMTKKICNE